MPRLGSIYDQLPLSCPSPMKCAICNNSLEDLSESARQAHYETHFADSPPRKAAPISQPSIVPSTQFASAFGSSSASTSSNSRLPLFQLPKTTTKFWTPSYASDRPPPMNYTPNFIPILRRALVKSHAKGTTSRASLCSESVCHIATEGWDSTYGCGYRNYMMACTALYEQQVMPQYFALLAQGDEGGPGIRNLQELIEQAWSEGYDTIGASQLKYKLVGTMKWIGAGEIWTAFTYRGIPARLIDFPESRSDPEALTRWVSNYFFPPTPKSKANAHSTLSGAAPVIQTEKMPLILQHQGHSRTIVGIEINRAGAPNLLVFDPAKRIPAKLRKQAISSLPSPKPSKPPPHANPQATPTSTKQGKEKMIFDRLFLAKRPRFVDDDEDDDEEKERDAKRGKHGEDGKSNSVGSGSRAGKPATEQDLSDYMSVLKVVRVNLSNLKKKDKYQILELTLDLPLSDEEKVRRKVVTSEKWSLSLLSFDRYLAGPTSPLLFRPPPMSRQSILRASTNTSRIGTPSVGSRNTGPSASATIGGYYGGIRDDTKKISEYSAKDDQCPVCKTERYFNQKMRLLVSTCYHKMCDSCIERLYSLGPAPCPICGKTLRKMGFMTQTFEDLGVEKEVVIRRRMAKEFNKRRENFPDLRSYNDYLEEVEDITFNLINDVDLEKTEARIASYRAENAALIELNIQREERDLMAAQEEEERERQERLDRAKDIRREEELERVERAKEGQRILEDLARGKDAKQVVAQSREAAVKREEKRIAERNAAIMATMSTMKRRGEVMIPDPPHKPLADDWYDYSDKYVLRREYEDAVSELVRGDMERLALAGGYRVEDAWDRAVRYAVAGLETKPLVGLSSGDA